MFIFMFIEYKIYFLKILEKMLELYKKDETVGGSTSEMNIIDKRNLIIILSQKGNRTFQTHFFKVNLSV